MEYEQVGNAKVVHAAPAPYANALRQLVAYAAGVPHIVRTVYENVDDIDEIFIHGSWAARFHGEPGSPPRDLDLVIVSLSHTRFTLAPYRTAIEVETGMTVDQMILAPDNERLESLRAGSVPVLVPRDTRT